MPDLAQLTATEFLRFYRSGQLSPREVVSEALAAIDRLNDRLNMFYTVDHEGALAAAAASEERWRKGEPIGLLDGVPTSVKDGLSWVGTPMYRGAAAHDRDCISKLDAPCVARLKEHNAVFLGKTTMPDFGILASGTSSKHGITRNPWNLDANPGGSSSGAAASIASCVNPVAVGTDIVGSIRLPASFCGLAGHKPSQGRVPYYFPNSPALVAGPMARTVEDAALLMNVIAEPDSRDFTALPYEKIDYRAALVDGIKGRKFGVLRTLGFGLELDADVAALFDRATSTLEDVGAVLIEKAPPFAPGADEPAAHFYRARTMAELSRYPERERALPFVGAWAAEASRSTAPELYACFNGMQSMRERALQLMDDVDFLVLPSVPVKPYPADVPNPAGTSLFAPWCNNFVFNLTEQPAFSVNCGFTPDGFPVGLQIVGRRFDDVGVFQAASAYEKARPFTTRWPSL